MGKSKLTNLGIIGPNGIGFNHARIFNNKGVNIKSILSSSQNSVCTSADLYKNYFGLKPLAFTKIEEMVTSGLDAVSICSPYEHHLSHIINCMDHDIPVLCEKPLFWDESFTYESVQKKLEVIENHSKRRIFTNTCNAAFLAMLSKKLPGDITFFKFIFHTQGKYTYTNIAIDLLPHAISFILQLFGVREIKKFKYKLLENNFICSFIYGDVDVELDFQEKIDGKKNLSFITNDIKFERIQRGKGKNYVVSFRSSDDNSISEVRDPFEVYISKFIDYCNHGAKYYNDSFCEDKNNLLLMAKILELIKLKL